MTGTQAAKATRPVAAIFTFIVALGLIVGLATLTTSLLNDAPESQAAVEIVEAIAAESTAVTNSYFSGPEVAAELAAKAVHRDLEPELHVDFLRDLTIAQPNLDGAFIGYPDGSFLDVRRDEPDLLRIKQIDFVDRERRVTLEIADLEGLVVETSELIGDTYDPRTRPWYQGTLSGQDHWTDPYEFFTLGEPGVTYSIPILDDNDAVVAVVGVDIRLTNLNSFLMARQPSENGGAAVLNESGEVVAGSMSAAGGAEVRELIGVWLSQSSVDPIIERLPGDDGHVVAIAPVAEDRSRVLVVNAPPTDFLDGVRADRRSRALFAVALGVTGVLLLLLGARLVAHSLDDLDRLASTDALTKVLNRTAVHNAISQALRNGSTATVMVMDLDGFKLINDRYGHDRGDEALVQTAERLLRASPENAIVARLGGDEFCLVLIDEDDPGELCVSIVESVAGQLKLRDYLFDLELSAGFVSADSQELDASTLLQRADVAMYEAKSRAGTAVVTFSESLTMPSRWDSNRKEQLMTAIRSGQIVVHFQPEFDIATGDAVAAEALLRWEHPNEGLLQAEAFINDLHRFDLFHQVVPIVFAKAEQLASAITNTDHFSIRLNVTPEDLVSTQLAQFLNDMAEQTIVRWAVELPEGSISSASATDLHTLDEFRKIGVHVVVDDFGAGALSLESLDSLPIDAVKIAPEFVRRIDTDPVGQPLAAVLVELGLALGAETIAKGIETESQATGLLAMGCTRGQGFSLGEPVTSDEFVKRWVRVAYTPAA